MKLVMIGCSHHTASIEVREQLAFSPAGVESTLDQFQVRFPGAEAVLLSTCNRTELYAAWEDPGQLLTHHDLVEFLASACGADPGVVFQQLGERTGEDAVRHLFTVAASLDSMVVGEAQILSQVKQAYETASGLRTTGPLLHLAFQAAIRAARRVSTETAIHERRVSIPSVAVGDFARGVFERFDDKQVLVIGAGEMGEETLRYLVDHGAARIRVVNRSFERAEALAVKFGGQADAWERLDELLIEADMVVSTTGASEPIMRWDRFAAIESARGQRLLLILDLAVPRDFDPEIGRRGHNVFLYSVDDLRAACEANRQAREAEWPAAERILEEETARFVAELNHRATGPTIRRLRQLAAELQERELERLFRRLPEADERSRQEIQRSFHRLVNKLLHPPLESLRDEAANGAPHNLIEALNRLFQLQ